MKNILKIAEKFEAKLKKLASYPDKDSVTRVVDSVCEEMENSPELAQLEKVYTQSADVDTMDASLKVVVLLGFNGSRYSEIVEGPLRQQISQAVAAKLEAALQQNFRTFKPVVKVSFVPEQ